MANLMIDRLFEVSTELKGLLNEVNYKITLEKDNYLFQEGTEANELYIIQSGRVQLSKITPDGKELTLRICSSGDLIGEISIFSGMAKYMLNAKVLQDGTFLVIKKEQLEEELLKNSQLAFEFMKWMSLHYQKTQTKLRDLVLNGKKGALYSTLIRLSNSYGEKQGNNIYIKIPMTNQELANFCGTSRESINRMLSDLRNQNIISISKGHITIYDLKFLKDAINCEDCPIEICSIE